MFKASIEKFRQLVGWVAIASLAIAPFFASLADFAAQKSVQKATPAGAEQNADAGFRGEYPAPSFEDLVPAVEEVRSARMALLRCAADQRDDELTAATVRYQEAIRVWKDAFRKVLERSHADESRSMCYEFFATQSSDDASRRLYEWEVDRSEISQMDGKRGIR